MNYELPRPGRKSTLTSEQKVALKLALWNGVPHKHLSMQYSMSAVYMTKVTAGTLLNDIPWPDSSTGGMPQYRKDQLALDRKRNTVTQNTHGGLPPAAPGSIRSRQTPAEVQAMINEWEAIEELARVNRLAERDKWRAELRAKHMAEGIDVDEDNSSPYAQPNVTDHTKLPRADWNTLLEQYPDVGVIRLAEDDMILQDAICIAAAAPGHPKIDSDGFMKVCAQIKKSLMVVDPFQHQLS